MTLELKDFIMNISTAHNSDNLNGGILWENNILLDCLSRNLIFESKSLILTGPISI